MQVDAGWKPRLVADAGRQLGQCEDDLMEFHTALRAAMKKAGN